MYSDEEILEHLTEGEGRGFLGRSMYDAIMEEIEQLTISLQAQEELTISWYNKTKEQGKEIERLNNIINRTTKYVESLSSSGRGCDIYEDIKQEILKELKGSDKE